MAATFNTKGLSKPALALMEDLSKGVPDQSQWLATMFDNFVRQVGELLMAGIEVEDARARLLERHARVTARARTAEGWHPGTDAFFGAVIDQAVAAAADVQRWAIAQVEAEAKEAARSAEVAKARDVRGLMARLVGTSQ